MSDKSGIQWTDATWNPVTGCSKVSPGCAHCYAETVALRFWPSQYPPVEHQEYSVDCCCYVTEARARLFTDVQCHKDRLSQPLRWARPRRVFVNSMSDLFHEAVPDAFIDQIFAVMALAPQHTFQVLTKRAARMRDYLCQARRDRWQAAADMMPGHRHVLTWPLPNVWLGVSVENQHFADERIPLLLDTLAAVRFLSCEPLLEGLDLAKHRPGALGLNWVIVGGESGPGARVFDLDWGYQIIAQCRNAGVACFVKQIGSNPRPIKKPRQSKGGDMDEWPEDLRVREYPR